MVNNLAYFKKFFCFCAFERIKLPSCFEKIVPSDCLTMIDQLTKDPTLKAEDNYHKYRLNTLICNSWAGGHVSNVRRPPGKRLGLLATRRTGRLHGLE